MNWPMRRRRRPATEMTKPLLRILNRHSAECGAPPHVTDADPNVYIGYFENPFGEQWVFTFNKKTRQGELRGGDVDWTRVYSVVNGTVAGLVLGPEETVWLLACWRAATCGA
jgi:hypothetical protein